MSHEGAHVVTSIPDPLPVTVSPTSVQTTTPLDASKGAFGSALVESLQPVAGWNFSTNAFNARLVNTRATGAGTRAITFGLASVSTTAAANTSSLCETRRALRYVNGIGGCLRIAGRFTTGAANSRQELGLGDVSDFLGFGYLGAIFGIWWRRQGLRQIVTLTMTVGTAGAENVTITLNGVAAPLIPVGAGASPTLVADTIAAADFSAVGTGWNAYAVGATVVFVAMVATPLAGAYTLTSPGTAAGNFVTTTLGVAATETFTAQAAWSEGAFAWLDPTKLNVYQVQFQWLGSGGINFFVEDPALRRFVLCHVIAFAGTSTTTSLRNPQLPVRMYVQNDANATDIAVFSASAMGFRESLAQTDDVLTLSWGARASKAGITTEQAVISVRNPYSVNGVFNRSRFTLLGATFYAEGNGINPVSFSIRRSVTLGGTPSWANLATDSIAQIDTAGTTISGGTNLYPAELGRNTPAMLDLTHLGLVLAPGETWTLSVVTATTVTANVSLQWLELL